MKLICDETETGYTFPDDTDFTHRTEVELRWPVTKIPSSLMFDTKFLRFLFGDYTTPNQDWCCTSTILFPQLCLPGFHCKIRMINPSFECWLVGIRCNCSKPFGLFCQSLRTIALESWMQTTTNYIELASVREPEPKTFITNFVGLEHRFEIYHPLRCMYKLLCRATRDEEFELTRDGNLYTLSLSPGYMCWDMYRALTQIVFGERLPFTLTIECYPFKRVICHAGI